MVNGLKQKMNILRYPRLDTVLMVEETLQKINYYPTKMELWKELPKKTMYQTFCVIIEYLDTSGKIVIDDGKIIWIWDPASIRQLREKGLIVK